MADRSSSLEIQPRRSSTEHSIRSLCVSGTYGRLLSLFNFFIRITRAYLFGIGTIFMISTIIAFTVSACYTGYKSGEKVVSLVPNWLVFFSLPVCLVLFATIIDEMANLFVDAVASKVPFASLRGRMMACYLTMRWQGTSGDDGNMQEARRNESVSTFEVGEKVMRRNAGEKWAYGYVTSVSPLEVTMKDDSEIREGVRWDEVRKVQELPTQFSWWFIDFVFVFLCNGTPSIVTALRFVCLNDVPSPPPSQANAPARSDFQQRAGPFYEYQSMGLISSMCALVLVSLLCNIYIAGMSSSTDNRQVDPKVFKECIEKHSIRVGSMGNLGWFMLLVTIQIIVFLWDANWWVVMCSGSIFLALSALAINREWEDHLLKPWCGAYSQCTKWKQWLEARKELRRNVNSCPEKLKQLLCENSESDPDPYRWYIKAEPYGRWWRLLSLILTCFWIAASIVAACGRNQGVGWPFLVMTIIGMCLVIVYGCTYYKSLRFRNANAPYFLRLPFCFSLTLCLLAALMFSVVWHFSGILDLRVVRQRDVTQIMTAAEREDFQLWQENWLRNPHANNPVCRLAYGHNNSLSVIDMGVLAYYSYTLDNGPTSKMKNEEQYNTTFKYVKEAFGKAFPNPVLNTTPCGNENMFWVDLNTTTVVVVRGTASADDLALDAMVFAASAILQVADNLLVPVLSLVPKDLVGWLISFSMPHELRESFKNTTECVQQIRNSPNQTKRVVITGHSLGGLIAESVGVELGIETIVFSAPGFERIRAALTHAPNASALFSADEAEQTYDMIAPAKDPVAMIDAHPDQSVVHTIGCQASRSKNIVLMNANLNFACHSIVRTVCQLERYCGTFRNYSACHKMDSDPE